MSAALVAAATPISQVCIYAGVASYSTSVLKQIDLFKRIKLLREAQKQSAWEIHTATDNVFLETLKKLPPKETLLVVPAGESSKLDLVFPAAETDSILNDFFKKGGRGYFTCGSAYWTSRLRLFTGYHPAQVKGGATAAKASQLPLFPGTAVGPLCLLAAAQHKVGFYTEATTVTDGQKEYTVYNSGGGSFVLPPVAETTQKTVVVARYLATELQRLGKPASEHETLQNAACMTSVGEGAALLTMFHPYYEAKDIDPSKVPAASGTDWGQVKAKLSSGADLMHFTLRMLARLNTMDFTETTPSIVATSKK